MVEQHIQMNDGHIIVARLLKPVGHSRGHIHLLHGMAEYSARYIPFAESLVEEGYTVSMHDHRGHGKTAEVNQATRGFFAKRRGFQTVVDDVETVTRALVQGEQFILFGHSMGSFIARRYAQLYQNRLERLILCGTGFATPVHYAGRIVARVLANVQGDETPSPLMNTLSLKSFNKRFLPNRSDFDWLALNERAVDGYLDDPYCGFTSTTRFYADLTDGTTLVSKTAEIAKTPDIPILLISGEKDAVGQNGQGVFKLAKKLHQTGKRHVQVYLAENMRHELLNERNSAHTIAQIKRWLKNE